MTEHHGYRNRTADAGGRPDVDALIQRATERPGIREMMRVCEDWERADRAMDAYRSATTWVDSTSSGSRT